MLPHRWELNPGYELIALQLISALIEPGGRFLAVQWRSEDWHKQRSPKDRGPDDAADARRPDALAACAAWAAQRVTAALRE